MEIRAKMFKVDELVHDPRSLEIYKDKPDAEMLNTVKEDGYDPDSLIVVAPDGKTVLSGNLRLMVAKNLGITELPGVISQESNPHLQTIKIVRMNKPLRTIDNLKRQAEWKAVNEAVMALEKQLQEEEEPVTVEPDPVAKKSKKKGRPKSTITKETKEELISQETGMSKNEVRQRELLSGEIAALRKKGMDDEAKLVEQTLSDKTVNAARKEAKKFLQPSKAETKGKAKNVVTKVAGNDGLVKAKKAAEDVWRHAPQWLRDDTEFRAAWELLMDKIDGEEDDE